ncbi:serine protease, S1-C subfamily, contains C-terminal PDZ domain [Prosthecobacter debontii]|uniref:Serine protease, S1-C subfamily, contains C-terminal PDZ domain n=1 Tax=Prosthecobacter debontii TaxID=48467 RepID=A0A1T4XYT3_9BACT|nr:PDZ domain-containing protein [Prosthecobacter debontii]SKA94553.1 serine protease, S1-C subfamily, contains C-terminal PDZ domain [Prosthecobacter debontii]
MKPFLTLALLFLTGIATAPAQTAASAAETPAAPPRLAPPATPPPPGKPQEPSPGHNPIGTIAKPGPMRPLERTTPQSPILQANSLLKVNVTYQGYNQRIPWQKDSAGGRRGLGVVLEGNRVLVTAQMVADATYIELELPESGQKIAARVLAVDYEANLALLAANSIPARNASFFAGLTPMEVDTSARIGDTLVVWQTGRVGDLIVTPMRVSKVMNQGYVVDNASFIVYEAQGIIRSEANSFTLPVAKGGKLAALLLRYDSKNQIATLLPAPIIEHFLKDVADGQYDGFPSMGIEFQITLDDQFREYLGMKPEQPGVYISGVTPGASADKAGVKKGDIMMAINGYSIDSRGDYIDPQFGPLSVSHVVRGKAFVGDEVEMKVLRDGKEITLKGKLARKQPDDYLVRPYLFDQGPKYLLSGGLLFQELTRPYLNTFGSEQQGGPILRLNRIAGSPEAYEKKGVKHIVFLSAVLPTVSTQGYERLSGQIVEEINGVTIKQLGDVAEAFKKPQNGLHTVKLEQYPFIIYLDAIKVERDNLQLMNGMFRIGSLSRLD